MTKIGLIIVVITALLVSLSSIFSRFAYDADANPQTIVLFRFLVFYFIYALLFSKSIKLFSIPKDKHVSVISTGIFYTLGAGSLMASIYFLPVSLAVIIFYTYPIITMIGTKVLDKQRPGLIEIGCFLLAFVGLLFALNIDVSSVNLTGILFGSCAAITMACSYLISDRTLKEIDPFYLTFRLAIIGLILAVSFIVATNSFQIGAISLSNLSNVFLASLCFALGFFLMFKGINLIGAVNTAMILNLEPIFTIALAFILLNESLSPLQLVGAVLVLVAILGLQRHQVDINRTKS